MNDTKFILLLKTLNNQEFKGFNNYLNCFYKTRKKDIAVFNLIAPPRKIFNPQKISLSVTVLNRLKKKGFTEKNLTTNHLFYLGNYLEEFLVWQKFKDNTDSFEKDKLLLAIYKERKFEKLHENKYLKLKANLKKLPSNMWTFFKLFELDYQRYFSAPNDRRTIKGKEMKVILESLDGFFISTKLKLSIEQFFRKDIFGKELNIQLLEECLTLADTLPIFKDNLSIQVFKYIFKLKNNPNHKDYLQLKALIFENHHIEEQNDQTLYFAFLINYIASALKRGQLDYASEAKECIEYALEKRFFFEGSYINTTVFHNWVNITSIGQQDVKYAEEIIATYLPFINPVEKENILLIANAYVALAKKDFDSVINMLKPSKISNRLMNLRSRLILIKAYYENDEMGNLLKFLETSRKSIKNDSNLGTTNKESALNTIKYTLKLFDNIDIITFKKEVNNLEYIFNKSWLLEKIR